MLRLTKKILCSALTAVMVLGSAFALPAAAEENILLGKTAKANIDSVYASAIGADKMTDGDTAWDSRYASVASPTKALVVTIDLGQVYSVDSLTILDRNIGTTCSDSTTVELGVKTSLTTIWTTVAKERPLSTTAVDQVATTAFTFAETDCDQIRITFDKKNGDYTQYQIVELMASGTANSSYTPPTNIMQGKTVTSSVPTIYASVLDVRNMTDGDLTTRFASKTDASGKVPMTAIVNLGAVYDISYIDVVERCVGSTCGARTDIDVGVTDANGVTLWRRVVENGALNTGGLESHTAFAPENACGDKVRFIFDGSANNYPQYQIIELIAYGKSASAPEIEIEGHSLKNGGSTVKKLAAGENTLTVSFPYLVNEDNTYRDVFLLAGVYDDETGEKVWGEAENVSLGLANSASFTIQATAEWADYDIETLLWSAASGVTADTFTSSLNLLSSIVTLTGQISVCDGEFILVAFDDSAAVTGIDASNFASKVCYWRAAETDENGKVDTGFKLTADSDGAYRFALIDPVSGNACLSDNTVDYYTPGTLDNIVKQYFAGADAATLITLLTNTYSYLFDLGSADVSVVAGYLALEQEKNDDFQTYAQLSAAIQTAIAFDTMSKATTADAFQQLLEGNTSFTSQSAYEAYTNILNDEQRLAVAEAVWSMGAVHISQMQEKFNTEVILTAVNNMNWTFMNQLLTKNSAHFPASLNISGYQTLANSGNNASVDKEIIKNGPYRTLELLCAAVNNAINNYYTGLQTPVVNTPTTPNKTVVAAGTKLSAEATTTPAESAKKEFGDLATVPWAKTAISELVKQGIVNGKTEEEFEPNSLITREEFTKLVALAFKLTASNAALPFTDVSAEDWFFGYLQQAYAEGLINGRTENSFGTGENITRQELAVILTRAIEKYTELSRGSSNFSDWDTIADYAWEGVEKLVHAGIITGMEDGSFAPESYATRAQAVVMIYRALTYMGGIEA